MTPCLRGSRAWHRATWALVVGVALVRVVFLVWFSPYELTGDEAHYWEWSRRPALSYYSKGPGVAWTIWGSTRVLGDAEWAVRMPSVVFGAVGALAVAGLARRMAGESEKRETKSEHEGSAERVGFVAAGMFCLIPAYQAIGLLMTIDGGYVACWAAAALLGWMGIVEKKRWALVACAAVLGVGFLFKYTILLLVVGLAGAAWWVRKDAASRRGVINANADTQGCHPGLTQVAASRLSGTWVLSSVLVFLIVISPVIVWNWQHDWPTVKHLLGHLGAAGGDQAHEAKKAWRWDPLWTLEFIGTQAALIGPLLVLMVLGVRGQPRRHGDTEKGTGSGTETEVVDRRAVWLSVPLVVKTFCLGCAAPILVFYFFTSFATDVEGNWPIAGYVTLIPLAAMVVVRRWMARSGSPGWHPARKRASLVRGMWHGAIVYGVVAGVGMMSLAQLAKAPGIGRFVPAYRLNGARATAERVEALLGEHPGAFVVASRYDTASLLAYYLPGHPAVRSATSAMGGRRSSYDFFADTRLDDPRIMGGTAVMVGGNEKKWSRALGFDEVRVVEEETEGHPALRVGLGYRGLAEGGATER